MQKFVIYRRLSRDSKSGGNLGLEAQQSAVYRFLSSRPHEIVAEFEEVQTSNVKKNKDRPQLRAALQTCKEHSATLLVARLDRLHRNVAATAALLESDIEFICVDNPSITKFSLQILSCVAEKELEDISTRTKAALAVLKQRGVKLGPKNKRLTAVDSLPYRQQLNEKKKQNALEFAQKVYPTLKFFKQNGLNNAKIAQKMNERGDKTPSGVGKWQSITVERCLKRSEFV